MQMINKDDKEYYNNQLYEIHLWGGVGYTTEQYYVYSDCEQTSLEILVAYLENNDPNMLFTVQEMETFIANNFEEEYKQYELENKEYLEETNSDLFISFAQEYLNNLYIDATEYGASKPYFILTENMDIYKIDIIKE